jgi:HEAT repeat protein
MPLLAEVKQNKGRQSWLALKTLMCIEDDRIIPYLILILLLVDSGLQGMIIEILGKSHDERTVPVLIQYLMVENTFIQIATIQALRNINNLAAVNPLLFVLAQTQSPSVRYTIIETLGDLSDPCAIEPILAYQDDENHHVRTRVERALAKLTSDL